MPFTHLGQVTAPSWIADGNSLTDAAAELPVGSIVKSIEAPTVGTWLACDGAVYLQATYPTLFAAIGHLPWPGTWVGQPSQWLFNPPSSITMANSNHYLKGFTTSGGYYIASIASGEIQRSTDGVTWTAATGTVQANKLAANGSGTVVGLYSINLKTSTDHGDTWSQITGPSVMSSVGGHSLAYGNSLWLVACQGTIYSSPDLTTWTSRVTASSGTFYEITWNGSLFVAATNTNLIYTSSNGTSWTARTSAVAGSATLWTQILWVPATSKWVMVGQNGAIQHSANGTSWTAPAAPTALTLQAVAYFNSLYVVAGVDGCVFTSPDLTTWTERVAGNAVTTTSYAVYQLWVIGSTLHAFTPYLRNYSTLDGITWTTKYPPDMVQIAGNGSIHVGASRNGRTYVSSNNGDTWTAYRIASATNWTPKGISYLSGVSKFFAFGNGTSLPNIYSSTDGQSWNSAVTSGIATTETVNSVSYCNGAYFAGTIAGVLYRSTTGTTWSAVTLPGTPTNPIWPVFYANGVYLVTSMASTTSAGIQGLMWRSTDGITWVQIPAPIISCGTQHWEYDAGVTDGYPFMAITRLGRTMRGNSTGTVWKYEAGPAGTPNQSLNVIKHTDNSYSCFDDQSDTVWRSTNGWFWNRFVPTNSIATSPGIGLLMGTSVENTVCFGQHKYIPDFGFDIATEFRVPNLSTITTTYNVNHWIKAA